MDDSGERRETTWARDGSEVVPNGDVGGDVQVGGSWAVRFRPDVEPVPGLHAMVTESFFASDLGIDDGQELPADHLDHVRFTVTCYTEWLVCSDPGDPGGTEVWSDAVFADLDLRCSDLDAADQEAWQYAATSLAEDVVWRDPPSRVAAPTGDTPTL